MPVILSDEEIADLLRERKLLCDDYVARLQMRPKRGYKEADLEITGESGSRFQIRLRQSSSQPLDFSVILLYHVPGTNRDIRLVRYNGDHGGHTNFIERTRVHGCHVHRATERYQGIANKADGYAESTTRYVDLHGALRCLLQDCNFELPNVDQRSLLKGNP